MLLSRVNRSLPEEDLLFESNADTGGAEDEVGLVEDKPKRSLSAKAGVDTEAAVEGEVPETKLEESSLPKFISFSEFLRSALSFSVPFELEVPLCPSCGEESLETFANTNPALRGTEALSSTTSIHTEEPLLFVPILTDVRNRK